MKKLVAIVAVAFFVLVNVLLVLPAEDIPDFNFLGFLTDKFQHAFVYAFMCLLFSLAFWLSGNYERKTYIAISVCAIVHGIAMEFVQKYFTTNRAFDIWDMVADFFGVLINYLVFSQLIQRKKIGPCRNRGRNQN